MLKINSKIFLFAMLPVFAFLLMSTGGGTKRPGNGKSKGGSSCNVEERNAKITLFSFHQRPPGRNTSHGNAVPAAPSLWTGGVSASGLFGDPNKYYCVITVSASCKNYQKKYVWKADQTGGNTMTIPVPENMEFRVNVEYWEQCGPFWGSNSSPSYKRGLWLAERTFTYSSLMSISSSDWVFIRSENC